MAVSLDSPAKRGLWLAAAFLALVFLPFSGKAFHNDEPFFLAAGRHALAEPARPLNFDYTWYGHGLPAAQINTTPPLLFYVLALALKLTGGGERAMRLALFPLDLAAVIALYLLAGRFLKRPLLPVLLVVATPAYLINMNYLMPEKLAGALGFWGLYALVRGVDERSGAWFWSAAGLLGTAILSKYNAGLFLAPAAAYAFFNGVKPGRIAGLLLAALMPAVALVASYARFNPDLIQRFWSVASGSQASWWSVWPHKSRSFLAFVGGCGVVTMLWPWRWACRRAALGAAAAAVVLFLPALDLAVKVRLIDRLTGVFMAASALLCLAQVFSPEARRLRGWPLWAAWLVAAGLTQLLYWSIMARMVLFMLPPLIFLMAERVEASPGGEAMTPLLAASLAVTVVLSASLAIVDYRYAAGQKEFSRQIAADYLAKGRRVWYSGYMGLAHYLSEAGAQGLDAARGGWDLAKPGDAVVVLGINSYHVQPRRPVLADQTTAVLGCAIPLRLMSGWTGEGGFYSNLSGFLPYSLSREPLETFTVVALK